MDFSIPLPQDYLPLLPTSARNMLDFIPVPIHKSPKEEVFSNFFRSPVTDFSVLLLYDNYILREPMSHFFLPLPAHISLSSLLYLHSKLVPCPTQFPRIADLYTASPPQFLAEIINNEHDGSVLDERNLNNLCF